MTRILLLEDDLSLIDGLSYSLQKQGFETDIARTLGEAAGLFSAGKYDLLLLDVSLPDGSGFDFCKKVRAQSDVPIIFLTASDGEVSVIMGLDIGGDDYITKPFKLGVLISRINALLRRTKDSVATATDTQITSNGITVYRLQGEAHKDGVHLDLTAIEYKLLCLFMQNPGVVLSKESILDKLWDGNGDYVDNNTLAVYIRRLRMKIESDPSKPEMLVTIRGLGYKWNVGDGI
jgi:DNA-binding response OmpR family regulator